jgi:hypothetical protein
MDTTQYYGVWKYQVASSTAPHMRGAYAAYSDMLT